MDKGINVNKEMIDSLRTFLLNDSKENTLEHIDNIIEILVLSGTLSEYNLTNSMWVLFEFKKLVASLDYPQVRN